MIELCSSYRQKSLNRFISFAPLMPLFLASHAMLRLANSPMRYLFRWTRIIQRHPVNAAR